MKETKIELNGMSCASCERLIRRVAEKNSIAVNSLDVKTGEVVVFCESEKLEPFKKQLADKGFTEKASDPNFSRGDPKRVKKYISSILAADSEVETESRLFNYSIASTAILFVIGGLVYSYLIAPTFQNAAAYLPLFILAVLSSVITVFSYYHMLSYRKNLSCMNGMMIGMTLGMISGFLVGGIIGATNGMFVGSVAGIFVGAVFGVNVGKCCGIMGALEGLMAALMAGVMGAMTSVMLIRDNLVLFLYILFGISSVILGGLSYMMYRESEGEPTQTKVNFGDFLIEAILLAGFIIAIVLYGPRGTLIYP
ncbi:hypothetical protein HZC07_00805 [Candidatus Micrarchaeota archaeon]|nr:hypothetical protein [Candidatus Micrarchaeota archaeon]